MATIDECDDAGAESELEAGVIAGEFRVVLLSLRQTAAS